MHHLLSSARAVNSKCEITKKSLRYSTYTKDPRKVYLQLLLPEKVVQTEELIGYILDALLIPDFRKVAQTTVS